MDTYRSRIVDIVLRSLVTPFQLPSLHLIADFPICQMQMAKCFDAASSPFKRNLISTNVCTYAKFFWLVLMYFSVPFFMYLNSSLFIDVYLMSQ